MIKRSLVERARMSAPSSEIITAETRETMERYEIPISLSKGVVWKAAPPSNARRATAKAVHARVILMASVGEVANAPESMLHIRKTNSRKRMAAISGLNDRLSFSTLQLWQIANRLTAATRGSALETMSSEDKSKDENSVEKTTGDTIRVRNAISVPQSSWFSSLSDLVLRNEFS